MRSWSRDRPTSTSSCARTMCPRPARPCSAASSRRSGRQGREPGGGLRARRRRARRACCWRSARTRSRRCSKTSLRDRRRAAAHRARATRVRRGIALICLADDARERDHRRARRERDAARRRTCPLWTASAILLLQLETPLDAVIGIRPDGASARREGGAQRRARARASDGAARRRRRADRQRGRAREGRGASRRFDRATCSLRSSVPCCSRHARRARVSARASGGAFFSQPAFPVAAGRHDGRRRHVLRRARRGAGVGAPPAARHCDARAPPQRSRRRGSARSRAFRPTTKSRRCCAPMRTAAAAPPTSSPPTAACDHATS